jgi:alkylhydroperoxidase family enzyme
VRRIAGDPRALHPGVQETYAFIRANVLERGVVDQELKELCFRYVAEDPEVMDLDRFEGRERAALEWAHAIVWDSDRADDDLWRRLHEHFSEPELVDLGCAIGFELGQRNFLRTLS